MKAAIAGAGLIGRLLAFELLKSGWDVTLYDSDAIDGDASCSIAAAGLLAPTNNLAHADPLIYRLGLESLKLWPGIIKQLGEPVDYHQSGTIVTAHPQDQAELTRFVKVISNKITDPELCQHLSVAQLSTLEPELTKFSNCYYFPQEAHIDNPQLLKALAKEIIAKGVTWHVQTPVIDVKPGKIILENNTVTFDMVFDCRGLGAKSNWPDLRGVRGELFWLHAPDVHITRPVRLLHPRYCIYIVPRPNQVYVVGASEIETEDKSPVSVRSALEYLSAAYSVHSGFIEARILKLVANCRPAFPDNLPRVQYNDGYIAINGLYRHGYVVAPALINEIMQFLQSK